MKSILLFLTFVILIININSNAISRQEPQWDSSEITGYHFHTYFFQGNENSNREALSFRTQIQNEINEGFLTGCRMDQVNYGPHGPHPVGNFETCCNSSAISHGISWFMKNRGNLTILFHPLTRWELIDHTERALFLGKSFSLDLSILDWDLGEAHKCLPIPNV